MTQTRPEIQQALGRFRRWIRRYIFLEGLAVVIALACGLFWLTYGLDVGWFWLSQLELPSSFRIMTLLMAMVVLAAVLLTWLVARLFRTMRARDLALALERRFPQLNDRLITAVELGETGGSELQTQMLHQNTDEVAQALDRLPIEESFNATPLRRSLIVAGTLFVSVLVLGLTHAQGMERWYNAYILGKDNYWEPFRKNALKVQIISQPGDRVREFDDQRVYKHPKGSDLQILATVAEGTIPPANATMQFISFGGSRQDRGRVNMSRVGDEEFRHTLGRVVNDHNVWIRAGDFINRAPFRIQVVDPPKIDAIEISADYPSYTGMDSQEDRVIPVVGTQVSLPMETSFQLTAQANKPLTRVHLSGPDFQLSFGYEQKGEALSALPTRFSVQLPENSSKSVTIPVLPDMLLNKERNAFTIPFVVSQRAQQQLAAINDELQLPIPISPDTLIQMTLEDGDQISSQEPTSLAINGIVDEAPVVDTRRIGIGNVVTRIARIPVEGTITDDYGVARAWFGYRRSDQDEDLQTKPLATEMKGRTRVEIQTAPEQKLEYFDLIPLQMEEEQTLTLAVYAEDGDTINGPHEAHGEILSFKIVSKDDLIGRLYDREINLRLRFEQIRAEVGNLQQELAGIQEQVEELESGSESESPAMALTSAYVERGLHQIRKNHTESRSIEVSFRDLRGEMINNRVDTEEMLERIEKGVIEPLAALNEKEFLQADREFGAFRLSLQRQAGIGNAFAELDPALDELLAKMDAILAEMKDRGSYNDLIQSLQEIIDRQKKLLEKTEDKRIEDNFFTPLN
ncbi:MAG: hypothetical protein KDA80_08790 [Planctomycetaceae bacterium]|nr:hypothetical protein [Planctomycetaceae bacterium]